MNDMKIKEKNNCKWKNCVGIVLETEQSHRILYHFPSSIVDGILSELWRKPHSYKSSPEIWSSMCLTTRAMRATMSGVFCRVGVFLLEFSIVFAPRQPQAIALGPCPSRKSAWLGHGPGGNRPPAAFGWGGRWPPPRHF